MPLKKIGAKALNVGVLIAWTLGWLFLTVNPYFSAWTLVPEFWGTWPVLTFVLAAAWFALSPVLTLLSRLRYILISEAALIAATGFALIKTGQPITDAGWWQTQGVLYIGLLIAWAFVGVLYWRGMRGMVAVDDADTGGH